MGKRLWRTYSKEVAPQVKQYEHRTVRSFELEKKAMLRRVVPIKQKMLGQLVTVPTDKAARADLAQKLRGFVVRRKGGQAAKLTHEVDLAQRALKQPGQWEVLSRKGFWIEV